MTILITGGAGFIGSNFVRYWLKNHPDDKVVNFDALTYAGNLENLDDVSNYSNYQFIKGDITHSKEVEAALEGVDQIVHFAAESHVDRSIMNPLIFVQTNVLGTQILLNAALKKMIKFHHVSTDEVYGSLTLGTTDKFTVETKYDPSSPYSASKAASNHLVMAYHRTYGLPTTISNCSNNFGPYQFPEKFIPLVITNLLEGLAIPVYGDGQQIRDWLHVSDHCRAIDLIINKGQLGKTYLVGGMTQDITNLEVVRRIVEIMQGDESLIKHVTDRPGHDVRYAIDWSETARELGYMPQASFEDFLKQTIEWYKQNRVWWQHVKSGEYQTFYQKQYGN